MKTSSKVDLSEVLSGLQNLGNVGYSLARSMGVAAGSMIREEAKLRVPADTGLLRDSIYLAFRDAESTNTRIKYTISWNTSKAPHGHLIEFGHMRYNKVADGRFRRSLRPGVSRGRGPQDHVGPGALDKPVWVPAQPFMRPAYDASLPRIKQVMADRARKRLPELLQGVNETGPKA